MTRSLCILVGLLLLCAVSMVAQVDTVGRMVLSEGLEFHVAAVQPHIAPGESLSPDAFVLVLTSRQGAQVTLNDQQMIQIPAGEAILHRIDDLSANIRLRGDRPFHVSTYQDLLGNGEQAWHLPTYAWGMAYRPFQWWQDSYGVDGEPETVTVATMSILSGEQPTMVEVDNNGSTETYQLDPFSVLVLDEEEQEGASRDLSSDRTGREVRASHPVAVISGHTKGGVLRYPIGLPPIGEYARPANRSRGNLHDAMLPVEYAGTEFVTVPLRYTPTRVRGYDLEAQGIEDDEGDVIRFIALEDGTEIRSSGPGVEDHVDTVMNAGDAWYSSRVEEPRVWTANKPVLCAHYGKSFGRITSQWDRPDLDPSVDAGMPLLQVVPSVTQWTDHAIFTTQDETTNFLNLVCNSDDAASMLLNGQPLSARLARRDIPGTSYATFSGPIGFGSYRVTVSDADARFAAWTYGSEDGLQLGRIYGSVASMDLTIACDDTLRINEQVFADSVVFTYDVTADRDCGAIAMAYAERCNGGVVTRHDNGLTIARATPTTMVDGNILVVTRSGRFERRWFHLDGTTSIDEGGSGEHLLVAPHPVRDVLTIRATGDKPLTGTLYLISMTGERIRTIDVQDRSVIDVAVDSIAPGTYAVVGDTIRQMVVIAP